VEDLVAVLARERIADLALTTNGQRLSSRAAALRAAGLRRVNISLDTLDPQRFAESTRGANVAATREGIDAALASGLAPVKLNAVVMRGFNDGELARLVRFAMRRGCQMRFIELMPIGEAASRFDHWFVPADDILGALRSEFEVSEVHERCGRPATEYRARCLRTDREGTIGIVPSMTHPFCADCRRLRLTSRGRLRTCLFDPRELDLRLLLRRHGSDEALKGAVRAALAGKPAVRPEESIGRFRMAAIGG
jgi:cyclic pyranopterin phosphate synthase